MRKILKSVSAAVVGVGMLGSAALLSISQVAKVWADTTTLTFGFNITNSDGAPGLNLVAYDGEHGEIMGLGQAGDTLRVIVAGDEGIFRVLMEDGARNEISPDRVAVTCSSNESCRVEISGVDVSDAANGIRFVTTGDSPFELSYLNGDPYDFNNTFLEDENFAIRYRAIGGFEGAAYVIWACGEDDGEVCLHLLPEIVNEDFATEYYAADEMTDITDPTRVFDKFGAFEDEDYARGMALKSSVDEWVERNYGEGKTVADVDWSEIDLHLFLRGYDKGWMERKLIEDGTCEDGNEDTLHDCVDQYFIDHELEEGGGVKLQPVGEPQGNSSYVSYGDRNFRVTIYNENYKALTLGDLSDLHYIPNSYSDATYIDAIDISETTRENPAIMQSILLEERVSIKASAVGGLEIASIEALDAPEGAIGIEGNNNEYEFVFHSNFYDAVIFKITDTEGHDYYLRVERSVLDNWIREESVQTTFYFDAETSYQDYELIATYVYKDGTSVEKEMRNAQRIDDGLGNVTIAYEMEAGQNLKMATYVIDEERGFSDELEGVYFNARKAGTTELIYAGTLVGSGLGVYEPMSNYRH